MIFSIFDIVIDGSVFVAKRTYGLGYWLIWGAPETEEHKLLCKLLKNQEELQQRAEEENKKLQEELKKIKQTLNIDIKEESS